MLAHDEALSHDEEHHDDYPTEKIGNGNPYSCCVYCKKSTPEINGFLSRHSPWCKYRMDKEKGNGKPSAEVIMELIHQLSKEQRAHLILEIERNFCKCGGTSDCTCWDSDL